MERGAEHPEKPGTCSPPASGPRSPGLGLRSSTPRPPARGLRRLSGAPFPAEPRAVATGQLERPGGPVETGGRSRQRRPSFLEWGLLLLLLLVAGALVALGLLYAPNSPPTARILKNMDPSQDPCEDFYQHACGGWLRRIIEERDSQPLLDILAVVGGWPVGGRSALGVGFMGSKAEITPFPPVSATMQNYLVWHLVQDRISSLSQRFKDARAKYRKTLFIQSVLSSVRIELLPDEEVVVYGIPYLQKLESIIGVFSDRCSREAREVLYGKTTNEVRWRECVSYVNSNMESAVGSLYVKKAFSRGSKNVVGELIDKMRAVFVETLGELSWMDEASKKKAQEKAMSMKVQIGYPDYILDERSMYLDKEYSNAQGGARCPDWPTPTLAGAVPGMAGGIGPSGWPRGRVQETGLHVTSSLLSWIIGAAVVNAFYSPNRNQIVFPAGILQPPFFSKDQPQALNFGGIGMVIGHEITHGFDDNGRNFDEEGNMLDWWSNFSAQHFQEQAQCMVHQYGSYSWDLAEQQNVNGFSTLGENIADNGGVRQAYKVGLGSAWSPQSDRVPLPNECSRPLGHPEGPAWPGRGGCRLLCPRVALTLALGWPLSVSKYDRDGHGTSLHHGPALGVRCSF
ncbi:PREDICTED: membrane metallo-endopeptidase-like 1 [Myotis davidii]|uniref:membrane metallo-endopeptidase-like 1 n=1 Tax=Myotis davidii TaxID=225400 RepID=UPI0007671AC1|nr:PREDICTED: membrane metallo-endopeptidase-like 1 [Myotis davidii]